MFKELITNLIPEVGAGWEIIGEDTAPRNLQELSQEDEYK